MIILQGAREKCNLLRFSPDGQALFAPSSRGVQVWDGFATGRPRRLVLPHLHVSSVHFTPDGQKLLLHESRPHRLVLRDLPTGAVVEVPLDLPDPLGMYCGLTPDGRFLVAAQVVIGQGTLTRVCCRHLADVTSCVWSLDTARSVFAPPLFLAGGEKFILFEWCRHFPEGYHRYRPVYVTRDARTGAVLSEVASSGDQFSGPVLSPDTRLIAARRGFWIRVFRADDLGTKPVEFRNDNRTEFTGLAFHPSGRYLAAASNTMVKMYETSTWEVVRAFAWDIGRPRSVAFSPDGMLAVAGGDKGKIVVWDMDL